MELKFGEIFVTDVYLGCYTEAISLNRVLHKRVSVNLEPFTQVCCDVKCSDSLQVDLGRQSIRELY